MRNGVGQMLSQNGDIFQGNYKDSKKHGSGNYIWANG